MRLSDFRRNFRRDAIDAMMIMMMAAAIIGLIALLLVVLVVELGLVGGLIFTAVALTFAVLIASGKVPSIVDRMTDRG